MFIDLTALRLVDALIFVAVTVTAVGGIKVLFAIFARKVVLSGHGRSLRRATVAGAEAPNGGFSQTTEIGLMRKLMRASNNHQSVLASTVGRTVALIPMRARPVALFTVLVFANLPAITFAQSSCPRIHVKILDIKNSAGVVACALFETSEGFPTEFLRSATNVIMTKVQDAQARCDFVDIPPGTYALAVIHDENMDGELGTNWMGVPTEGYGFSDDATASMTAPSFEAARFTYEGENLDLTISLNY
jgi:uncharacterized protein (DUF2141 family)